MIVGASPAADTFLGAITAALTVPDPKPVLVVVHEAALAWRCAHLRRKYPRATVSLLATRNNFLATNWAALSSAAFVVTTYETLTSVWYQSHAATVMERMVVDPKAAMAMAAQYPRGNAPLFFDTRGQSSGGARLAVLPHPGTAAKVRAACGDAADSIMFPVLELAEFGVVVAADVHGLAKLPFGQTCEGVGNSCGVAMTAAVKALRRMHTRHVWVSTTRLGDMCVLNPWVQLCGGVHLARQPLPLALSQPRPPQFPLSTKHDLGACLGMLHDRVIVMNSFRPGPTLEPRPMRMTPLESICHYQQGQRRRKNVILDRDTILYVYGGDVVATGKVCTDDIRDFIMDPQSDVAYADGDHESESEQEQPEQPEPEPEPEPEPDFETQTETEAAEEETEEHEDNEVKWSAELDYHNDCGVVFYWQHHGHDLTEQVSDPVSVLGDSDVHTEDTEGTTSHGDGDDEDDEDNGAGAEEAEEGLHHQDAATTESDTTLEDSEVTEDSSDDELGKLSDMSRNLTTLEQRITAAFAEGGDFGGPCTICMDSDNKATTMMTCGHVCCPECAVKWVARKKRCTVCKAPFTSMCVLDHPVHNVPSFRGWLLTLLLQQPPGTNVLIIVPEADTVLTCVEVIDSLGRDAPDLVTRCPQTKTPASSQLSAVMKLASALQTRGSSLGLQDADGNGLGVIAVTSARDMVIGVHMPSIDCAVFVADSWTGRELLLQDAVATLDSATRCVLLVPEPWFHSALPETSP
jgi:hypothetical protein